jgi:hypothetical protein
VVCDEEIGPESVVIDLGAGEGCDPDFEEPFALKFVDVTHELSFSGAYHAGDSGVAGVREGIGALEPGEDGPDAFGAEGEVRTLVKPVRVR